MNDRYFACVNCRRYTNAGYRWAYWMLEETGVVSLRSGVDVESVLNYAEYWNPSDEERNDWLAHSIFPTVHRFLEEHRAHGVVYVESDDIWAEDSLIQNWVEVDNMSSGV